MQSQPQAPPVLSTPDTRLAEAATSTVVQAVERSDEQLEAVYEIQRTIADIQRGGWRRVTLQFPDDLLPDAPRVYRRLRDGLKRFGSTEQAAGLEGAPSRGSVQRDAPTAGSSADTDMSLFILADTSYSACCVDEVAAEHVEADVVVHYGRACLSPTARLPVIHVFTIQDLDHGPLVQAFESTYPEKDARVIIAADMPYISHVPSFTEELRQRGYQNLFETSIRHDPSSPIPNRTIPSSTGKDPSDLTSWLLFHISDPPQALLLTLASRVSSIHIYPTSDLSSPSSKALQASTSLALRRRYALVTRLSRASIIGILANTLSVHAYQAALEGTQARIAAAGKKSYVFAMGRLNSAKIANFAEVDGWVVLGCWESSLIENTEFDKPVVAPFELALALQGDKQRIWTGEWRGDFDNMTSLPEAESGAKHDPNDKNEGEKDQGDGDGDGGWQELGSDSESEPPEFDLRTGRYITSSRPMNTKGNGTAQPANGDSPAHSLVRRAKGDVAIIGGELSPGAQYLRDKRTWRGLGSDFEIAYEDNDQDSTAIREGRSGIARGYENEKSSG